MTPSLGPGFDTVIKATEAAWYDNGIGSPQLGDTAFDETGRLRMWVEASGTIADAASPGTQIALTVTGPDNVTAASGSGGWYSLPAAIYGTDILAGDRFWAAKVTAP
jgi:hypothetical protein